MPEPWWLWLMPPIFVVAVVVLWLENRRYRRTLTVVGRRSEMYRSIVERQTELICRYLPDTTLTFVNDAYCRYFGREREQLIGRSFLPLLPESAHAAARQHVAHLLAVRRTAPIEHEVIRADGTIAWQQWLDYLIVGPDNKIVEVQAVGRDITECRSELAHLSRVAVLGQLTAPLAHEISQPITSILGNAQAALRVLEQETRARDPLHEIVMDIADEARRANLVIHSLRKLLQRGEVSLGPVDLNRLILDTTLLTRPALQTSQIRVRYSLSADLPAVTADPVQLQQVIRNLIVNARDAMEPIEPMQRTLAIATTATDDGCVECTIRDAGVGISPQSLQRIFDPYFSTKESGTGLGLSICSTIIAAHGGQLWATNNKNSPGATLAFRLHTAGRLH